MNMGLALMKFILSESKNEKVVPRNRSVVSFGKDYKFKVVFKINDKEFIK